MLLDKLKMLQGKNDIVRRQRVTRKRRWENHSHCLFSDCHSNLRQANRWGVRWKGGGGGGGGSSVRGSESFFLMHPSNHTCNYFPSFSFGSSTIWKWDRFIIWGSLEEGHLRCNMIRKGNRKGEWKRNEKEGVARSIIIACHWIGFDAMVVHTSAC